MLSDEERADLDAEALALLAPAPSEHGGVRINQGKPLETEDSVHWRIVERIKVGEYVHRACEAEGVSYGAFYDRCLLRKELAEARDEALQAAELHRLEKAAERAELAEDKEEAVCARVQADIALRRAEMRNKREAAQLGGGKVNIYAGDGAKVMVQWEQEVAAGAGPALPGLQDVDLPVIEASPIEQNQ